MELSTDQQIFDLIKKSNKILIVLPQNASADYISSALALKLFLSRLQKDVVVVSSALLPENLNFLPGISEIKSQIDAGKSLVIAVDTSQKKLEELSYQTSSDKARIFLKSKGDSFTAQDVTFSQDKFPIDLVISLGVKTLEDLGQIYEQQADLFFETPKINIDNSPQNEYFGQVNLVDVTATSVAEILSELLQKYEEQLLDEDIATCLLTGIIAQTHSFQHVHTTPKAFLKASELVNLGGRQQEIVKNIFKTKSLALLKLWGRALARMKILDKENTIYSLLNFTDFEKAEATPGELLPALSELVVNVSGYKLVGLLAEVEKGLIKFLCALHEQLPAGKFLGNLGGSQVKILDSTLGNFVIVQASFEQSTLEDIEKKFLEAVKSL